MAKARAAATANLRAALAAIRAANATAPIRLVGLYDPSSDAGAARRVEREELLRWNVALEEACLTVSGCLVVPVADLFEGRPDRLAGDRFHPGPAGYDQIAARVLSTLVTSPATGAAARQSER
jgi:lysophospholipase L1-like esterase